MQPENGVVGNLGFAKPPPLTDEEVQHWRKLKREGVSGVEARRQVLQERKQS